MKEKASQTKKSGLPINTLLGYLKKAEKPLEECVVDNEVQNLSNEEATTPPASNHTALSFAKTDIIDIDDTPAKPIHPFFKAKATVKSEPESSPTDTSQVPSEPTDSALRRSSRRTAIIQRYNEVDDSDDDVVFAPPPKKPKQQVVVHPINTTTCRSNKGAAKTFFMTKDQKLEMKAQDLMTKFQEERLKSRQASQQFYAQKSSKSSVNPFLMMRQAAREISTDCSSPDIIEEFNPFPEFQHTNVPNIRVLTSASSRAPIMHRVRSNSLASTSSFHHHPCDKQCFTPFPDQSDLLHAWISYIAATYNINNPLAGENRAFVDIIDAMRPSFAGPANHAYSKLLQWLQQWSQPAYDSDDEYSASNICILEGESGACKSSLAHAAAKVCGYTLIEVNTTHVRSLANVKKMVAESAQSRRVTNASDRNLILFDEANVLFEDDSGLHAAISQLARDSKCPILVASEKAISIKTLANEPRVISCARPSEEDLATYLYDVCCDYCSIPIAEFHWLSRITNCNPRTCLHTLHLLFTACVGSNVRNASVTSYEDALIMNRMGCYALSRYIGECGVDIDHRCTSYTLYKPEIFRFDPDVLNLYSDSVVRIHGKYFLQRSSNREVLPVSVYFDSVPVEVRVISDTMIYARLPRSTDTGRYIACVMLRVGGVGNIAACCETSVQVISEQYPLICTLSTSARPNITHKAKTPRKVTHKAIEADSDDDFDTTTVAIKHRRIIDDDDDFGRSSSNGTTKSCSNTNDDEEDIFLRRRKPSKHVCDVDDEESVYSSNTTLDESVEMDVKVSGDVGVDNHEAEMECLCASQVATQLDEILPTPVLSVDLQNKMLSIVDMLMALPIAEPFLLPVPMSKFRGYKSLIPHPMDLSTIKASIQESLYEDITTLTSDVTLMCRNCLVYNGIDSEISHWAVMLFTRYMNELVQLGLYSSPTTSELSESDYAALLRDVEVDREDDAADPLTYCISSDYMESLEQLDSLCLCKSDADIWTTPLYDSSEDETVLSDFTTCTSEACSDKYWELEPLQYIASDVLRFADNLYGGSLPSNSSRVFQPLSYSVMKKQCRAVYGATTQYLPKLSSCMSNALQLYSVKRSICVDIIPMLIAMLRPQSDVVRAIAQDASVRSTRYRNKSLELRYSHVSHVLPVDESVFDELLALYSLKCL